MLKLLSTILLVITFSLSNNLYAQTISSTPAGGVWTSGSTWVGGVVPIVTNDVIINGVVQVRSTNACRNITISTGATLEADPTWGGTSTLTIDGSIINNGLVRNATNGWPLHLSISGDITNNGTWMHSQTNLTGTASRTLTLGDGKKFESVIVKTDSSGVITANSSLALTKSFNLAKSFLNMQSNALTLETSSANISNGVVLNTADLTLRSGARLENITYRGSPNLKGVVQIRSSVVKMEGTVTVVDTLEADPGWSGTSTLTIDGSFINNGLVRNATNGWLLHLSISGNITNNGTWIHSQTNLTGTASRTFTLEEGKKFESIFVKTDSAGVVTANSPLAFTKSFNLTKGIFNLVSYALTLETSSGNISNGVVLNTGDLILRNSARLDNITYRGSPNLKGVVQIRSSWVRMEGTVTVVDTLEADPGWSGTSTLTIDGSFINNGLVRNATNGWPLHLSISGNITNNGTMTLSSINLTGIGSRTIVIPNVVPTYFTSTGSNVILVGDNMLPNLYLATGSRCVVAADASLNFTQFIILSKDIENRGKISIPRLIANSWQSYNFVSGGLTIGAGSGLDSLTVETYGYQVPETFANAVRQWWRFIPTPYITSTSISSIFLNYKDTEVGNNTESTLQVFHSSDSGASWRQISTSLNIVRDTVNNWVKITSNLPIAGDYLISSNPDPVSVRPSVILSVIGRDQIRVGPPNRYTIHYVNNSDVSTSDMIMEIKSQGLVNISRIEPSMPVGVAQQNIPIDSLTYDGNKEQALLWVTSMAPREERTFDVIFVAYPDATPKVNEITSPNETKAIPLIAAGLWWAAKGLAVAYVTDATLNMTEEIWRPVALCETVGEALKDAVKESFRKTNEEWFGWEKPAKEISKNAAEELLKLKGINIPSTVILDATGKTINGMQRYLQDDFKIKDCEGKDRPPTGDVTKNTKPLQKTMSWDPNEKVAPAGFGELGFISSAGRMNYRILFENLKAATAPAWRIIIIDTLSDVFDPQSVVFGSTSHEGPQYNWIKTRDGNILRWEIEDIELPPNVNPPEGEGYVDFSVLVKSGLPTGTEIRNKAMIVFDYNPPIITNEVVNTLDFLAPVTQMLELPAQVDPPKLTVRWNTIDGANGSGVQSVILYASENGGAYNQIGTTDADSFVVSVNPGSNYSFYALGKDNVGNVEQVRPVSVATVVTSVSTNDNENIPKQFALHQNYPNPFNPTTTIRFDLPVETDIKLTLYNILGEKVATLIDSRLKAGVHHAQFDGTKLSSGVYFYQLVVSSTEPLRAGSFVQTKKLLLIK